MADGTAINEGQDRDGLRTAGVRALGCGFIARLEKIFFFLLALYPFAMGAVYALVNMAGGWARFSERRTYAFYGILEHGFAFLPGAAIAGGLFLVTWAVSRRISREYSSKRQLLLDIAWMFAVSFGIRALFFLMFGTGMGNSWDPLWAWERACGLPLSDNRHILFPAWMNFALLMRAFFTVFGNHFSLFQLLETSWGGIGSVAVLLLARELTGSRRLAVAAGLLHAFSPNAIVYLTAFATPEHAAAPLFSLAAWLFLMCLVRNLRWGSCMKCALLSGLLLGAGDAIKPFAPVFLASAAMATLVAMFAAEPGRRRAAALKLGGAFVALVLARAVVCWGVTSASEHAFGCRLSRSDSVPHFICIGLDRSGEGMIHLGAHSHAYLNKRLAGMPHDTAADEVFKALKDDWRGNWGEIPSFLMKKTIWAWQDDTQAFHFYSWNQVHGYAVPPWVLKCMPWICRYGASGALVYYFLLMVFASFFAARIAMFTPADKRRRYLLPGLMVMGYFCLMLISESQGRYKCLVMPFVTIFAACAHLERRFPQFKMNGCKVLNDRLCVVMPVYNERDAIGTVLEKWARTLDALGVDYVIRPYNDGSRDDSLAVMNAKARELNSDGRNRIDVRNKPNGGHGNTILTGYREATTDGFGWIFQVDSDDEMGPERFSELWNRRNDFDFLVGIRDGRVQTLPRKIVSLVSRLCVRLFYGKAVWDVNTPYRLMRISAFRDFYAAIPLTTFAPNVILSGLAARYGLRAFEVRVPQHERTTGEVSIRKWKLLKSAVKSFWQTVVFSFSTIERT